MFMGEGGPLLSVDCAENFLQEKNTLAYSAETLTRMRKKFYKIDFRSTV